MILSEERKKDDLFSPFSLYFFTKKAEETKQNKQNKNTSSKKEKKRERETKKSSQLEVCWSVMFSDLL